MKISIIAASVVASIFSSCTSITSRFIGDRGDISTSKKFSGMPIMVDRPKWLKATYKTVKTAILAPAPAAENQIAGYTTLHETNIQNVDFEVVSLGEAYAMDLKRPMAGTAEWDIQFPDGKQYPKEVKNKVEDKSIAEVAAAAEKLAGATAKLITPAKPQENNENSTVQNVVLGETIERIEFYDVNNIEAGPVLVVDGKGNTLSRRYGK